MVPSSRAARRGSSVKPTTGLPSKKNLPVSGNLTSLRKRLWFIGPASTEKGTGETMAGKTPRGNTTKKEPKMTLKEKRDAKREKAETGFIKPRKGR